MSAASACILGLAIVLVVIALQMILPFAFDFISTLGVYGAGVFVGRQFFKT